MGKRALKRHAKGKKHQEALKMRRTVGPLFNSAVPEGKPSTENPQQPAEQEAEVEFILQEVSKAPQTSFVIKEEILLAVILWALRFVKFPIS